MVKSFALAKTIRLYGFEKHLKKVIFAREGLPLNDPPETPFPFSILFFFPTLHSCSVHGAGSENNPPSPPPNSSLGMRNAPILHNLHSFIMQIIIIIISCAFE